MLKAPILKSKYTKTKLKINIGELFRESELAYKKAKKCASTGRKV